MSHNTVTEVTYSCDTEKDIEGSGTRQSHTVWQRHVGLMGEVWSLG